MADFQDDIARYQEKIRRLQDNISSLRMSRRILMSLLEEVQLRNKEEIEHLYKEQTRLRKSGSNYAAIIWEKNKRICELEEQLRHLG